MFAEAISNGQAPLIASSSSQADKERPRIFGVEFICYLVCGFIGTLLFLALHRYVDACPLASTYPKMAAYPFSRFLIKEKAEIPLARIKVSGRDLNQSEDALKDTISKSLVKIIRNFNQHHNSSVPLFLRAENTEVAEVAYEQSQPWAAFSQRGASLEMLSLQKSFRAELAPRIRSNLLSRVLVYIGRRKAHPHSPDLERILFNNSHINRALQLIDVPKFEQAIKNQFICEEMSRFDPLQLQSFVASRVCILEQFLSDDSGCYNSDVWFWTQPVGRSLDQYLTTSRDVVRKLVHEPLPLTDTASLLNWATRLPVEDILAKKDSPMPSEALVAIGVWRYDDESQLRIHVSDFVTPSSWFSNLLATGRDCQPGRPFQGGGFMLQCASQAFHGTVVECRQNFNLLGHDEGIDTCVLPKSRADLAMVIEITKGTQTSTGVQEAYLANHARPQCSIDQDGKVTCLDENE